MHDIGKITRELQKRFELFEAPKATLETRKQNRATAANLLVLLESLRTVTDDIVERRNVVEWTDAGGEAVDADLLAWRERLAAYIDVAKHVPGDDRIHVLWPVTAPLLLGFYDGPTGTSPQKPIDAVTPFVLSNMLDVDEAWREERWTRLIDDLKKNATDLVDDIADTGSAWITGLAIGGALVGGIALVSWLRSMSK